MPKALPTAAPSRVDVVPIPAETASQRPDAPPELPLVALDQLWFQVAGTVCNLRCHHCFISCSPENHSFWFLSREEVRAALEQSVGLGVREYYFTGGEPFMNREMLDIVDDVLRYGPATVLTNATLLPQRSVDRLRSAAETSPYTLELRVSIDGFTAEMNDPIRGEGTFDRAIEAVGRLAAAGFLPIITAVQTWDDGAAEDVLSAFRGVLAEVGYDRPRVKILPPLRIGAEVERGGGYGPSDWVTSDMLVDYPDEYLLCSRSRLVTKNGVWACPILLDYDSARLGDTLSAAVDTPAKLAEQACFTCWQHGAICSNMPGLTQDFS